MPTETLSETSKSDGGFHNIVGRAPAMETLYRLMAKTARSTHPVLILGESGTGKEMVAKAIHYAGPCGDKPFVPVDCGSLVPAWSRANCSVMPKAHLPAPRSRKWDCWQWPMAARYFSMKWENFRLMSRQSCYALSKKEKFVRLAAQSGSR